MMLDSELDAPLAKEEAPEPAPDRRWRRRPSRRVKALLGGAAALAIGAVVVVLALSDGGGSEQNTSTLPTTPVVRTNMTTTAEEDGTLGFAGEYTILAGGSGTLTWLPSTGAVIDRGEVVYGLEGERVPLFYGKTPFYRDMQSGMSDGGDVKQLERNLDALGYGDDNDMTVDKNFTYATEQAIIDWQDDNGLSQTGVLKPGDVVVQPGAIRVTEMKAVLGGKAGGTLYTASGTGRQITVDLPVSRQTVAKKGATARVTLPGGKTATARITSVGTVASSSSSSSSTGTQTGESTETATLPVYLTLDGKSAAGALEGAPVTVGFTSAEHKNVLAVPVTALLATADGDYTVNVVDAGGAVRSVPVKLGIFDNDRVEVSGSLQAGMKVQVPKS